MGVAPSASSALGRHKRGLLGHIRHDGVALRLTDYRPPRNADNKVFTALASAAVPLAFFSVLRGIFAFVTKIREGRQIVINLEYYISALAAVAAVRSTGRHILFTMKGHRTVSACSGFYFYFCNINKHKLSFQISDR